MYFPAEATAKWTNECTWVCSFPSNTYKHFKSTNFFSSGLTLHIKDILIDYKPYISLDLYEVLIQKQRC